MAGPEGSRAVVVWGASGHALVVADILRLAGVEIAGFLDDVAPERGGEAFAGATVLGGGDQLPALAAAGLDRIALAVGDNRARMAAAERAKRAGFQLFNAIHPSAVVAADAALGSGLVVAAGVVINPACRIGDCAIINTRASVDHHCVIGPGAHIAPGATLAGHVAVGAGALIGAGCSVRDRISIGADSVVGTGSAVVADIPPGVVAFGNPARVVRPAPA